MSDAPATLSLQAYETIRTRILSGEYSLGSPMSRRKLAEELGMSLIPVSEALQRLESEGLVESKARAGTRVRIPTAADIRGHYVVREALESQSARLFAQMASRKNKSRLRKLAAQVDRLSMAVAAASAEQKSAASYVFEQAHLRLHRMIAECSQCPALVEAIERSRVLIYNWLFNVAADIGALPPRWHRDLADVLCTASPLEADEAMRRHVTYRQAEILERFEQLQRNGHFGRRFTRGPQKKG